jgi:hypothetical protein
MKRTEYEAIKARTDAGLTATVGSARITMVCVDVFGNAIHPDDLGAEAAAEFKARAEAFAHAARDRAALVKFIEDGFEIEWPDEPSAVDRGGKGEFHET